jgi:4'-phosphopantetheinyl transferase
MSAAGRVIDVHLWCVALDVVPDLGPDLGELEARLSGDERDRAARFVFARDRRRFVVARTALRSILAGWVGIAPDDLELEYPPSRKPALARWCRPADLRFNLSHCQDLALVALTCGHEIGVDVEQIRHFEEAGALVTGEFSAGERAVFETLPEASRSEAFLRAWVRKEAFLKATGEGLYRSLADVEVTFAPGEGARLLAVGGDALAAQRWSITSVVPCAGFTAAVVVEAPAHDVAFHGFHGAGPVCPADPLAPVGVTANRGA